METQRDFPAEMAKIWADAGWRPIETAPRTGLAFIAWGPYLSEASVFAWSSRMKRWVAVHDGSDVIESQSDFGTDYKTEAESCLSHWMPLPNPPKVSEPD